MPMLYSRKALLAEEDMIRRGIELYNSLLAINLERQLRVMEADTMNGDDDDTGN